MARAFAAAMSLQTKRMQFTVDVLPSDVIGFMALERHSGEPKLHPGAVFCNIFLADEINRTSSRTQAALLEVMEENRITVDGVTYPAMDPFIVIATQNPAGFRRHPAASGQSAGAIHDPSAQRISGYGK